MLSVCGICANIPVRTLTTWQRRGRVVKSVAGMGGGSRVTLQPRCEFATWDIVLKLLIATSTYAMHPAPLLWVDVRTLETTGTKLSRAVVPS
eukprot:5094835-Amphidinium_carterae.1